MRELVKDNIKDLMIGETQEVIALVKSVQAHRSKIGTSYQRVLIRDRYENEAACLLFDQLIPDENIPCVMRLKLNIGTYMDTLSYKIMEFELIHDIPKETFMPKARFNQSEAWNRIVNLSKNLREPLNLIVAFVLQTESNRLINYPMQTGYRGRGGILEATLKLVESVASMADIYHLDKDLMIAGAILYHIGSTETTDELGNIMPNDVLIGAANIANEKIVIAKIELVRMFSNIPERASVVSLLNQGEDIRLLQHIVLSRYCGLKTAIPEAIVLRALSGITLELDEINEMKREAVPGKVMTNSSLYNNKLYMRKM